MASTFPKLKKSYLERNPPARCLRPRPRNKYYGVITKRMNFISPVVETIESIEPNENDLELNAIAYTFSKFFQPELKQFLRRVVVNYLPMSFSEANGETKSKHLLCGGRFHYFWWHSGT